MNSCVKPVSNPSETQHGHPFPQEDSKVERGTNGAEREGIGGRGSGQETVMGGI